jgi:hypothetical protein
VARKPDSKRDAQPWTERRVLGLLDRVFPGEKGAFCVLPQVRNGTGFQRQVRTADALVVSCWPSRGIWFAGVEIKVSLADWRKELANPAKAADVMQWCDYWYLAAPAGVIPLGEVPESWGLVECQGQGAKIVKPARKLKPRPLTASFVACILRTVTERHVPRHEVERLVEAKAEEKLRWQRNELKNLAEQVERFEKETGVSVSSTWDHGNVRDALELVRKVKLNGRRGQVIYLRKEAERIAKTGCEMMALCDQVLAEAKRPKAALDGGEAIA